MDLKEKIISKISTSNCFADYEELLKEYCENVDPTNVYLNFKKDIGKVLIVETKYPIPTGDVTVMISDMNKDWQAPLYGLNDIGNPKLKTMSREDFDKTFEILSYAVQEKSKIIMDKIDILSGGYGRSSYKWEHDGKLKRIHYYQ